MTSSRLCWFYVYGTALPLWTTFNLFKVMYSDFFPFFRDVFLGNTGSENFFPPISPFREVLPFSASIHHHLDKPFLFTEEWLLWQWKSNAIHVLKGSTTLTAYWKSGKTWFTYASLFSVKKPSFMASGDVHFTAIIWVSLFRRKPKLAIFTRLLSQTKTLWAARPPWTMPFDDKYC